MRLELGSKTIELNVPKLTGGTVLGFLAFVALVAGGLSSWYTIKSDEAGIVLRFGKILKTAPPGLHFKAPYGIDQVVKVAVKRQQKQEFGFGTKGASNSSQYSNSNEMEAEKQMVSGDLNAALVEWVIQYRITEPTDYLFKVRHADLTLRDASESVMREVVGDRTVDEVNQAQQEKEKLINIAIAKNELIEVIRTTKDRQVTVVEELIEADKTGSVGKLVPIRNGRGVLEAEILAKSRKKLA